MSPIKHVGRDESVRRDDVAIWIAKRMSRTSAASTVSEHCVLPPSRRCGGPESFGECSTVTSLVHSGAVSCVQSGESGVTDGATRPSPIGSLT